MKQGEITQMRKKHKEKLGDQALSLSRFYQRIVYDKRSIRKAINTPKCTHGGSPYRGVIKEKIFYNDGDNEKQNIYNKRKDHCKIHLYPVTLEGFFWRIKRGMNIEDAVNTPIHGSVLTKKRKKL